MVVEVKDLREGDEIIISAHSELKYLRVLRDPKLSKNRVHWKTNQPLYKAVKCSMRIDPNLMYRRIECTPEEHNKTIYQDLEGRTIWLVKRKNQ
jgi:hypothetical protein